MYEWKNVYYEPEKFGLETVYVAEAGYAYEYDTFVIFRDPETDTHYWAHDAGCSCPTPFDDVTRENMPMGTLRDALTDLRAWATSNGYAAKDRELEARRIFDRAGVRYE